MQQVYRLKNIFSSGCDIMEHGIYIWNVRQTKRTGFSAEEAESGYNHHSGRTEAGYEPVFFLENCVVDYMVNGEGEFVLGDLIKEIDFFLI